jgi:hypothetical protein
MYYVIKRQADSPTMCFISFKVPKFIASKNSENVIFEFTKDNKTNRKWVKKSDIILLTQDKQFFMDTLHKFQEVQETQQLLVNEAQKKLEETMQTFTETVNTEIEEFEELRDSSDLPCILNNL